MDNQQNTDTANAGRFPAKRTPTQGASLRTAGWLACNQEPTDQSVDHEETHAQSADHD